jgi:DNA-binding transcriptional MerR regulator
MAHWYVKEISKLTGVSVQTMHHYDRIDLLKPSIRLTNGYRLYSEADLLKLQQIIALKFFGFELSQIKTFLVGTVDMTDHFSIQAKFLEEKAKTLLEASQTLKSIISENGDDKSIPWENIIRLIEVFKMTQELEKSWAAKVFTPEEFQQYARFEAGLKTRFTERDKQAFGKAWGGLVQQIAANLSQDPKSSVGINIAKQVMDLINGLYGEEFANLRSTIWEKGFKKGHMEGDHHMSPEMVAWLDSANDAYYRGRIYDILDRVSDDVSDEWHALMTEMYGTAEEPRQAVIAAAMTDDRISDDAKKWLKQL